ncbi:MAG: phosphoribosylformylglycinamidine synthase subunit PurS [Candidatus Omnitrophica bacterium]|nr:phosphoribosylformylglycinamidine synthase subunit PurS [Candidatus Omnitrophota bacterium]
MVKIYKIEVCNKKGIPDAFGLDVMKNIRETGIVKVKDVTTSDLYCFQGDISLEDIKRIADDVLLDKVIQEYIIREEDRGDFEDKGYGIVVDVFYKKGVTDAVAETVAVAVKDAGIKKDVKISTGKRYYIKGELTKKEIELICEKVLANRLVQDYVIH